MEYTIDMDFSLLKGSQTGEWISEFMSMADKAFQDKDDCLRLLGNLLIMDRYVNTLREGLAFSDKKISAGLEYACSLLWDYLEGNIIPTDFQDFANDYYDCLLAYSVGDVCDAPKEFYDKYFAGGTPDSYEQLAMEWSSGLLMQLVSIAGGRIDFDDFEGCRKIDFYGIDIMLHILEDACIGLTNTPLPTNMAKDLESAMEQARQTPLFQGIVRQVQDDLQVAVASVPSEFVSLRKECRERTIIPEQYAARLLEH